MPKDFNEVFSLKDLHSVKRIPPSIRGTVYEAMLQSVSEELAIWRSSIGKIKETFFDVDLVDIERLTVLANTFGVPFISSVKDDIDWFREEVRSIPFKIFYKGTTTLYRSFFLAVDRLGEIYVYTYQSGLSELSPSMLNPLNGVEDTPQNLPLRHRSRNDFSGVVKTWISLDENYFLDSDETLWKLDVNSSETTTNHIGIEYWIDRIIYRESVKNGQKISEELLMSKEYLDYLSVSMDFARRTKEVPHIGSQLSIITDTTGLCNFFDPSSEYSIPSLKLKVAARSDFSVHAPTGYDILYAEFGSGIRELPSVQNPDIPFPNDLANQMARVTIGFRNHYENSYISGAMGEYLGQTIQETKLLSGNMFDGVNQNFKFTLPIVPVKKGKAQFEFRLPDGITIYATRDDKKGGLLSIYAKGTLNYKTGEGTLTTKFDYPGTEFITRIVDDFKYNQKSSISDFLYNDESSSSFPYNALEGTPRFMQELVEGAETIVLNPGSIWLSFMTGTGVNKRSWLVQDNGSGEFVHPKIKFGKINYQTRILDIQFTESLVDKDIQPFKCTYTYPVDYALPTKTELWVNFYFTQDITSITEAGFRSRDGTLVVYATFPPMEFISNKYHCDFMALVKKELKRLV
jgi:hypothetical protein